MNTKVLKKTTRSTTRSEKVIIGTPKVLKVSPALQKLLNKISLADVNVGGHKGLTK